MVTVEIDLQEFLGSSCSRYVVEAGIIALKGLTGEIIFSPTKSCFPLISRSADFSEVTMSLCAGTLVASTYIWENLKKAGNSVHNTTGFWVEFKRNAKVNYFPDGYSAATMENRMIWTKWGLVFHWMNEKMYLYHRT